MICKAANKQKGARRPCETQICICIVECSLITRNKKILFNNHTHEHVMQVIFAGLLEFASNYSDTKCNFCWNILG